MRLCHNVLFTSWQYHLAQNIPHCLNQALSQYCCVPFTTCNASHTSLLLSQSTHTPTHTTTLYHQRLFTHLPRFHTLLSLSQLRVCSLSFLLVLFHTCSFSIHSLHFGVIVVIVIVVAVAIIVIIAVVKMLVLIAAAANNTTLAGWLAGGLLAGWLAWLAAAAATCSHCCHCVCKQSIQQGWLALHRSVL